MRMTFDDNEVLPVTVWSYLVRRRAHFKCEGEGPHKGRLHAHHVNCGHADSRLANGRCLCTACHGRIHNLGKNHTAAHREANSRAHVGLGKGRTHTKVHNDRIAAGVRRSWDERRRSS